MQTFFEDLCGKHLHFVGINGVGVNALAKYCFDAGATVSGSDRKLGDFCKYFAEHGCKIVEGSDIRLVEDADAVVFTTAINESNTELLHARELGIPTFERHEFLSLVSKNFDTVVGIAGSHGKTTVTAMVAHILKETNKNFVAMIGGDAINLSNYVNNMSGDGEKIFVTEACEYRRHMLALDPSVAVLLNTDWDHPDSYPTRESIEEAFAEFLKKAKTKVFACGNSVTMQDASGKTTFEYEAKHGETRVYLDKEYIGALCDMRGEYQKKNALFAIATAYALGVNPRDALKATRTFAGVKRRFEKVGEIDGVPVIFDFAHHPTEIKNLLERAGEYGKILAVFQPHTYSRTKAYMTEFADVFADKSNNIGTLILLPTYAAREPKDEANDSDALAGRIMSKNAKLNVYLAKDNTSSVEFVNMLAKSHDIVLFVGAGDIYDLKKCFDMQK
ncbi:MAG: hypothetical protein J5815_02125 [Clostridia bacterium]|nr:hypothetical protein [Clostridia bacterium]